MTHEIFGAVEELREALATVAGIQHVVAMQHAVVNRVEALALHDGYTSPTEGATPAVDGRNAETRKVQEAFYLEQHEGVTGARSQLRTDLRALHGAEAELEYYRTLIKAWIAVLTIPVEPKELSTHAVPIFGCGE